MQTWDLPGFKTWAAATEFLQKAYMPEPPKEGTQRNCPQRETTLRLLAHSFSEKPLPMLCLLRGTTLKHLPGQMRLLLRHLAPSVVSLPHNSTLRKWPKMVKGQKCSVRPWAAQSVSIRKS